VTDPYALVGKLVNINGEFGIIVSCVYDKMTDDHLITISFMDSVYGSATIEATWTTAIPFLVKNEDK
jgi:hypothetical protein